MMQSTEPPISRRSARHRSRPLRTTWSTSMIAQPVWRSMRSSIRRFPPGQSPAAAWQIYSRSPSIPTISASSRKRFASTTRTPTSPTKGNMSACHSAHWGDTARSLGPSSLVLTDAIVNAAYPGQPPPYLQPGQPFAAGAAYPSAFVAQLAPLAGYVYHAAGGAYSGGYYVDTERKRFRFPRLRHRAGAHARIARCAGSRDHDRV